MAGVNDSPAMQDAVALEARLQSLVSGVNTFLAALSNTRDFVQNASRAGGVADMAVQGALVRIDKAIVDLEDAKENIAAALADDAGASLTEDQRDLLREAGEEIDRASGIADTPATDSTGVESVAERLGDEIDRLEGRMEELAKALPADATKVERADRLTERNEAAAQHNALSAFQSAVEAVGGVLDDLQDTKILVIEHTVDGRNELERASLRDMMGARAADVGAEGYHWMHILGRVLGGADAAKTNVTAGEGTQNIRMMQLEMGLRAAADADHAVKLEISCALDRDSRLGHEINMRVTVADQKLEDIRFDLQQKYAPTTQEWQQVTDTLGDLRRDLAGGRSPIEAIGRLADLLRSEQSIKDAIAIEKEIERKMAEQDNRLAGIAQIKDKQHG
jgi:hypothetical protein